MEKEEIHRLTKELFQLLAKVNNPEDIEKLLYDLCTYNEIEQMSLRLDVAKMFLDGNTYSQIVAKTEVSSATLSRVSRCIQYGSGGYNEILKKIIEDEKNANK